MFSSETINNIYILYISAGHSRHYKEMKYFPGRDGFNFASLHLNIPQAAS